jgi:hypothetical protein
VEVGRCYLRTLNNDERKWSWTIYLGWHVKRTLEGVPTVGYAPTLEDAKHRFRECFDRMIEAGVVTLT